MELYLSKSKYCAGVQCPKMLWMEKNKPEEFDESVTDQVVLDNGSEVGDSAMGLFGEYVEVPFDSDLGKMIKKTEELLEAGTSIICEASFSYEGLFCSVDILKNLGGRRVELYEVKSSTEVKDIYNHDVAYQVYVVAKLPVEPWQIIQRCHHQPRWIYAKQSALVESPYIRILDPREPKTYATKKKEHVYTHVSTSAQAKKLVAASQRHVEEYDEQHGSSHQLAAIATNVGQLYILNLHSLGDGIRSIICFTAHDRAIVAMT